MASERALAFARTRRSLRTDAVSLGPADYATCRRESL